MKRRVVITGMGVISSLGSDLEEFYQNLLDGKSGISKIENFDPSNQSVQIAGEIKNFDPAQWIDKKEAKRMDRFCQFAVIAAQKAIKHSNLNLDNIDFDRVGVITASGIGGLHTLEENHKKVLERGPDRISPLFIPMMISDISAGYISKQWGFKGPNYSVTSACASSGHAIGNATRTIQYGDADIMITGGSEAVITPTATAGFAKMKATSRRNDEPQKASRPFDKDRDGFVMGEGSGMLILEEYEHAKKRGATIYAEVAGVGFTADAYDIVMPHEEGAGAQKAMDNAIKDSGIDLTDIDHINTHGTSTPRGDIAESTAIENLFGSYAQQIAINSTKSMIGHLLGAAGAVELIATVMAINTKRIHPTINLDNQDDNCRLNYTPNKYIEKDIRAAISNTFGFGGHNASILIKKISQ